MNVMHFRPFFSEQMFVSTRLIEQEVGVGSISRDPIEC